MTVASVYPGLEFQAYMHGVFLEKSYTPATPTVVYSYMRFAVKCVLTVVQQYCAAAQYFLQHGQQRL